MRSYTRIERLEKLLQEVLAESISRRIKDPKLGFVTVMGVQLSKDLHYAKVTVTVLGSEQIQEETMQVLDRASNFLREEISREVRMRYIPELKFVRSDIFEKQARLDELFSLIRKEEKYEN